MPGIILHATVCETEESARQYKVRGAEQTFLLGTTATRRAFWHRESSITEKTRESGVYGKGERTGSCDLGPGESEAQNRRYLICIYSVEGWLLEGKREYYWRVPLSR